jgi:hypothetical protein
MEKAKAAGQLRDAFGNREGEAGIGPAHPQLTKEELRDQLAENLLFIAAQVMSRGKAPVSAPRTVRGRKVKRPVTPSTTTPRTNLVTPKIGRGAWDEEPLRRGGTLELNPALLPGGRGALPFNEPVIDQKPATSATSIDLALPSYATAGSIRSRILAKAKPLEAYPASPKVLRVGVPDSHFLSQAQAQAIQQLTVELGQRGVQLIVVPVQ